MKITKTSCVDIGWDAEQCLDYLEMLACFCEAFGRAEGNDLELQTRTVKQFGYAMFEAVTKVREELNELKGDKS